MTDPLVEIALSYAQSSQKAITDNELNELGDIFDRFIKGQIPKSEASFKVEKIIGSANLVDKIDEIIQVSEEPIPNTQGEGNSRPKSKPWTKYEDQRLLAGIHKVGLESWNNVAAFVGNGRTRSQCSQRWNRGLNPKISKTCWSHDEEVKLLEYVEKYGERAWTRIANEFGNRSDVQCRYRYQQLSKDATLLDMDKIPEGPLSCPNVPIPNSSSVAHSPQNISTPKANSLPPSYDNSNSRQSSIFNLSDMMNLPPPIYQNTCFTPMDQSLMQPPMQPMQPPPIPKSKQSSPQQNSPSSPSAMSSSNFPHNFNSNANSNNSPSFVSNSPSPLMQSPKQQLPQIPIMSQMQPFGQQQQQQPLSPLPPDIPNPDNDFSYINNQRLPRMSLPNIDASFFIEY
ncbi:hypothetical protein M9Y10_039004 [Tritrichomonas musculus]|uniref:Myb-like DNA-binding domain containing protein n=1 Tax=Tritrichomonas musculus TaxID=1915356 RepID=A0ABR2KD54_9EUKA